MQKQLQLNLQETAHFNVQKKITFGSAQKVLISNANINQTYKNSQLYDSFFRNHHANFFQDNFQAVHKQIQQQETRKRIELLENAEIFKQNDKISKKEAESFGNFPVKQSAMSSEEQINSMIPTVLRESLQATSRIRKKQCKVEQKSINIQNLENDRDSEYSSNVDIDLKLASCLYQAQEEAKGQRKEFKKFTISKQIEITYVPFKHMKFGANKIGLNQKFGKKNHEKQEQFSSKSLYSNNLQQNNQLKDCMVNSTANFSKLHEVDLFIKRKEIRLQRSDQLLQANQKLLTGHLIMKQQIQKLKKTLERVTQQYKKKVQNLEHELRIQKQSKRHILADKQSKQLSLKNTKVLNQQYLKENNEMKQKIKEYIKIIHELKYYQVTKSTNNQHMQVQLQSKHHNCSIKTIGAQLPTINGLPSYFQNTDRSHQPIHSKKQARFHQQTEFTLVIDNSQKKQIVTKGKNHSKYQNDRKYSINDFNNQTYVANLCKNSQSQKSIMIKRNKTSYDNEYQNKNFMKPNKKVLNDRSLIIKRTQDQNNKSVSSVSNISGMSLTHKVGHIPKLHQRKKGALLDYMLLEGNELQKMEQMRTLK